MASAPSANVLGSTMRHSTSSIALSAVSTEDADNVQDSQESVESTGSLRPSDLGTSQVKEIESMLEQYHLQVSLESSAVKSKSRETSADSLLEDPIQEEAEQNEGDSDAEYSFEEESVDDSPELDGTATNTLLATMNPLAATGSPATPRIPPKTTEEKKFKKKTKPPKKMEEKLVKVEQSKTANQNPTLPTLTGSSSGGRIEPPKRRPSRSTRGKSITDATSPHPHTLRKTASNSVEERVPGSLSYRGVTKPQPEIQPRAKSLRIGTKTAPASSFDSLRTTSPASQHPKDPRAARSNSVTRRIALRPRDLPQTWSSAQPKTSSIESLESQQRAFSSAHSLGPSEKFPSDPTLHSESNLARPKSYESVRSEPPRVVRQESKVSIASTPPYTDGIPTPVGLDTYAEIRRAAWKLARTKVVGKPDQDEFRDLYNQSVDYIFRLLREEDSWAIPTENQMSLRDFDNGDEDVESALQQQIRHLQNKERNLLVGLWRNEWERVRNACPGWYEMRDHGFNLEARKNRVHLCSEKARTSAHACEQYVRTLHSGGVASALVALQSSLDQTGRGEEEKRLNEILRVAKDSLCECSCHC